jgi:hypothetical protein
MREVCQPKCLRDKENPLVRRDPWRGRLWFSLDFQTAFARWIEHPLDVAIGRPHDASDPLKPQHFFKTFSKGFRYQRGSFFGGPQ